MQLALDYLHQWEVAKHRPNRTAGVENNMQNPQLRWQKPVAGTLKCNVDAAFFEQENEYGIGMCIRDENDTFMGR